MASKGTWLDAGLDLLGRHGITALRIDRLADELGLSKGSFYHHFAGISAYRLDLLDHYETACTTRHIDLVESQINLPARDKLNRLRESVFTDRRDDDPALDIAMRAWASQDDDARVMQERVDTRRMEYLAQLWGDATGDRDGARDASRTIYLLLVGALHVVPPLPMRDLARLYDQILRQADLEAN